MHLSNHTSIRPVYTLSSISISSEPSFTGYENQFNIYSLTVLEIGNIWLFTRWMLTDSNLNTAQVFCQLAHLWVERFSNVLKAEGNCRICCISTARLQPLGKKIKETAFFWSWKRSIQKNRTERKNCSLIFSNESKQTFWRLSEWYIC